MKEFQILNGYKVKDGVARTYLDEMKIKVDPMFNGFVTPEEFGAVGDGVADDTSAISSAIKTQKDVYFTKTYLVTNDGLKLAYENQSLIFAGNAKIIGKNLTNTNPIIKLDANYIKLYNPKLELLNDNQTYDAIEISSKCKYSSLYNVYISGTGRYGLNINGSDNNVYGGVISGFKNGISVNAINIICEDLRVTLCTADGFVCNANHFNAKNIYSYSNSGRGFCFNGANYASLKNLYAEKNAGDGFYINNVNGKFSLYNCSGLSSGYNSTSKPSDFKISGSKNVKLVECNSSNNDENKTASYTINNYSVVYLYDCTATSAPNVPDKNVARFINCYDGLKSYNTALNQYKGVKKDINGGSTASFSHFTNEELNSDNDIISFDCTIQYAGTSSYSHGTAKYIIELGKTSYGTKITPIVEDTNITLNSYSVTFDTVSAIVKVTVKNNSNEVFVVNTTLTKIGSTN